MAFTIEQVQRPALVIAHNKTLAAQLCNEFREFFPNNAVEYFVSYYDYYQPEAYIPSADLYIEKDSSINEEIDRLRHAATAPVRPARRDRRGQRLLHLGLGSPEKYDAQILMLKKGEMVDRDEVLRKLVDIQYTRNDKELGRGTFRVRGETLEISRPTPRPPTASYSSATRSRRSSTSIHSPASSSRSSSTRHLARDALRHRPGRRSSARSTRSATSSSCAARN